MRYYRIEVSGDDGTVTNTYASFVNGATDLGALQVELDIMVTTQATPIAASIKIWGVSLQTIAQASDFNGKQIKVYAGMQKGLPLANPAQAGLVVQGTIYQAFGNWVGTSQWVEFIVVTNGAALGQKLNITMNWKKGAALADAIRQTLSIAAPDYKLNIAISAKLVLGSDETGVFQNMAQFAQYVKDTSIAILGKDDMTYQGVNILVAEKAFTIFDGTTQSAPKQIAFTDLIGQPTWIDPATIQVIAVMRADLSPGDYVQLPPAQTTTTAASQSQFRDKSVFQGAFLVSEVRHVGNFRQPDAQAWVTAMNCSPTRAAA